ncbi:hypothetical protein G6F43_003038 [Rhizopus delemar]|nr:hypothetical protein G6F43_003038 [Rhizopus delemar]
MLSAHVNALNIDAPSLFQIMKSKTDDNQGQVEGMSTELAIYGYNEEPLPSVEIARRNKDAVFNSLFDMEKVQHTCESNGLKFGQRMSFLPKLKVVRILGVKKTTVPPVKPQKMSYLKRILRDPNILLEGQKPLEDLKAETAKLEKEVKSLDQEREKALKCQKEQDSIKKIKALRKEWHNKLDKQTLYQRIEEERQLRDKTYLKINNIEDQLMEKKQVLYYQRMAIRHNSIHTVDTARAPPTTKKELKKASCGLVNSEACVLRNFEDFTFCGTDNGLVNMTAAVPFSLKRFSFHLKLHNYYSVLDDDNKAAPVATTISASEIDFGCGAFKQRVKRQTGKKLTGKGKEVQLTENSLSQKVTSTSNVSVEQFKHNFDAHVEHRKKLREFYNTGNKMNERRHREIQKHRFTHRIYTKERKALSQTSDNPSTKKKLVMFIGDRGTGVGSCIKGFKKYGGQWKEVIHSEAANACITNENLTSKTCIFCFRRLTHPRISVTKNGGIFSRKVKSSFYCTNPLCVSVLSKCAAKSRDSLSALAIGIVGLGTILFGAPLPAFKSHKISNNEAEKYTILTSPSRFEEETGSYAVVLEVRKGSSKVDHPETKLKFICLVVTVF